LFENKAFIELLRLLSPLRQDVHVAQGISESRSLSGKNA
jgi:hypothetical protein